MGADRARGRVAILPALTALAIVVVLIAPRPAATDEKAPTPAELWEWLIHFTNYAGYPKAAPVWAEIRIALAKRGVLPLPASLGPGRDPELDRERARPDKAKAGK